MKPTHRKIEIATTEIGEPKRSLASSDRGRVIDVLNQVEKKGRNRAHNSLFPRGRIRRAVGRASMAMLMAGGAGLVAGKVSDVVTADGKPSEADRQRELAQATARETEQLNLEHRLESGEIKPQDLSDTTIAVEVPSENIETQVLNGELQVQHGTLTLHSGATFTLTPTSDAQTSTGGNNIRIVPEGLQLEIEDPVIGTNPETGEQRYTFTMAGDGVLDETSADSTVAEMSPAAPAYWATLDVISETNEAGQPLAEFVPMPEPVVAALGDMTNVDYNPATGFSLNNGNDQAGIEPTKGGPIAQAQIVELA